MQVQHGLLLAAQLDLDHPSPIIMHLSHFVACAAASKEVFREDLMPPLHVLEPPSRADRWHQGTSGFRCI